MLSIPQNNLNRCCYECVYLIIFHGSTITGAVISDFVLQWSRGIRFYHASIQHHSSPLNRFSKNEDKITKQQIKQLSQTFIFMPCWIIKSGGCWIYKLVQVLFCRKLKIEMLVQLEIDVKILFFLFFLICSSTDRIGKKKIHVIPQSMKMFLWFSVCGYKGHKWQFHNNLKMHVYLNLL